MSDTKPITVRAAAEQYERANGGDSVSPALREVINQLIDGNVKTEFSNDSYLDALVLTDVMFHRSTSSVRLLTGAGVDGFLGTLKTTFTETLERLKQSQGIVKIIVLGKELPAWLDELVKRYTGTLQICRAMPTTKIRHFIVCDSKMSRLEEVHDEISDETDATTIKARVSFNEPGRAQVLENYFDMLWNTVEKFPINKV